MDRGPAIPPTKAVSRARELARLLDSAFRIPGTRIRIGLDAIIGLLPAGGDAIGAALSSIIVIAALDQGVPKPVIWRMVGNVVIDTLIGAVPLLGDLFDVGWKANTKNADLLEQYQSQPERTTTRSRGFAILVVAVLLLILAAIVAAGILVAKAVWALLT